jgi:hypothetical protein
MDQSEVLLDKHIKKLLACKPILACILQETVAECKNMSLEEVEASIEGTPLVEKIPVFPMNEMIVGSAQEDYQEGEGMVRYDIRTMLLLPNEEKHEMIKILIGVEAQKEDKPGYDIPIRALFYCSRMISSQLGTEFSNREDDPVKYGNIKKVYSIFICSDTAEIRANSVDRYSINRDTIIGQNRDDPRYDIMSAVIVNVGNKHDAKDTDSRMLKMLNDLLDEDMSAEEKVAALSACGIKVTREIETEVDSMCTYTASVLQRGRAEGRAEGRVEMIEQMLVSGKTPEEISSFTGIPFSEVKAVEESMSVNV